MINLETAYFGPKERHFTKYKSILVQLFNSQIKVEAVENFKASGCLV